MQVCVCGHDSARDARIESSNLKNTHTQCRGHCSGSKVRIHKTKTHKKRTNQTKRHTAKSDDSTSKMIWNGFSAGYKFALIKPIKVLRSNIESFRIDVLDAKLWYWHSVLLSGSWRRQQLKRFTSNSNETSKNGAGQWQQQPHNHQSMCSLLKINRISRIGSIGAHTHIKINAQYVSSNGREQSQMELHEMNSSKCSSGPFVAHKMRLAHPKRNEDIQCIGRLFCCTALFSSFTFIRRHFHFVCCWFLFSSPFLTAASSRSGSNSHQIKSQLRFAQISSDISKRGKKKHAPVHCRREERKAKRQRSNKKWQDLIKR